MTGLVSLPPGGYALADPRHWWPLPGWGRAVAVRCQAGWWLLRRPKQPKLWQMSIAPAVDVSRRV